MWASDGRARAGSAAIVEIERRGREAGAVANPGVFAWVMEPIARERTESAWVMSLSIHGDFMAVREIARGDVDRVDVPIHAAMRAAIDAGARYMILAHNHPSGFAWPSEDDANLTRAVDRAAAVNGLVLLDHVVLGARQAYSFREGRLWQT